MAIDQTRVAIDIATRSVEAAGQFINALETLEAELDHGLNAGISMVDYDTQLGETDSLRHVDGSIFNKLMAVVVPALRTWLETETEGGDTYEALFYKVVR